ncbi:MAG TPA: hypothetical protein VEK15_18385 [Vicinamibacteria bacterium]|nr:hypothetical protein [Vicinamibacteria bacterium]
MATILPEFDKLDFKHGEPVDNPYFPLQPGTILSYSGETKDHEIESNDVFTTFETRKIAGVTTTIVRDTAYVDGVLVEDTVDWYAQDKFGNVWYLGELTFAFEYDDNGVYVETVTDGSWEAGVVVDPEVDPTVTAQPGFIMPNAANLQDFLESGDTVFQEFAPGVAEDVSEVKSLTDEVQIDALGPDPVADVLRTLETTALEPEVADFKYFAPGIGNVRTEELSQKPNGTFQVDLTVDLVGIRDLDQVADNLKEAEASDFVGKGSTTYVTVIAADGDHSVGAYGFNQGTGEIGEGSILFSSTESLTAEDASASFELSRKEGLGLFIVPEGGALDEVGLDLSEFSDGGLVFTNFFTLSSATLGDGGAPLVSDGALSFEAPVNLPEFDGEEEVLPLPLQIFHALDGSSDGINLLNPAGGLQAVDLDWEDEAVTLLGFEDRRVTDPQYDGDYDDLVLAVSDGPLDAAAIQQIAAGLGLAEDTLIG